MSNTLDVVNINLFLASAVSLIRQVRVIVLIKLKANTLITLVTIYISLINLYILRELAISF